MATVSGQFESKETYLLLFINLRNIFLPLSSLKVSENYSFAMGKRTVASCTKEKWEQI